MQTSAPCFALLVILCSSSSGIAEEVFIDRRTEKSGPATHFLKFCATDQGYFGHAWVEWYQTQPGNAKVVLQHAWGFNPKVKESSVTFLWVDGLIYDDRMNRTDKAVRVAVDKGLYEAALKAKNDWGNAKYNLSERNCVHFLRKIAQVAGLPAPSPLPVRVRVNPFDPFLHGHLPDVVIQKPEQYLKLFQRECVPYECSLIWKTDSSVYLIIGGQRRKLHTPAEMVWIGTHLIKDWGDARVDWIPEGAFTLPEGWLVRSAKTQAIYVIRDSKKHHILTMKTAVLMGKWRDCPQSMLDRIADGDPIP